MEGASSILFPIEIALRMTDSLYPLGRSHPKMARLFYITNYQNSAKNNPISFLNIPPSSLPLSFIPYINNFDVL